MPARYPDLKSSTTRMLKTKPFIFSQIFSSNLLKLYEQHNPHFLLQKCEFPICLLPCPKSHIKTEFKYHFIHSFVLSINLLFIQQILTEYLLWGRHHAKITESKADQFCLLHISPIIIQIFNYKLKTAMNEKAPKTTRKHKWGTKKHTSDDVLTEWHVSWQGVQPSPGSRWSLAGLP